MNMKFSPVIVLIVFFFLTACSTKGSVTISPIELKTNGLLVGRITGDKPGKMILNGFVTIDDEKYSGVLNDGFIMLSLKPGSHVIQNIGNTSSSGGRGIHTSTDQLSVYREFTIKPGQVTNLGVVVVMANINNPDKYNKVFIDNNTDMESYIKTKHPDIYSVLLNKQFLLADGKYLNKNEIRNLRKIILSRLPKQDLDGDYAGTILGTLAKVKRKNNGELLGFSIYKLKTFEDIKICSKKKNRFACIIPNVNKGDKLVVSGENGMLWRAMPIEQENGKRLFLKLIGDKNIILVTDRLEIFSSNDNAKSWQTYVDAQLKEPIAEEYNIGFSEGRDGYYIYSRDDDSILLYHKYSESGYIKLDEPEKGDQLGDV